MKAMSTSNTKHHNAISLRKVEEYNHINSVKNKKIKFNRHISLDFLLPTLLLLLLWKGGDCYSIRSMVLFPSLN